MQSLRTRFGALVASTILGFSIVIAASALVTRDVRERLATIEDQQIPKLTLGPQLQSDFSSLVRTYQDAVAAHDLDSLDRARDVRGAMVQRVERGRGVLDPAVADEFLRSLADYDAAALDISRRMIANSGGEDLVVAIGGMQDRQKRTKQLLDRLVVFDERDLRAAFRAADEVASAGARTRLLVVVACLAVVLALSLALARSVVRSIALLQAGISRFGEGALDTPIDVGGTRDELTAVAEAANRMAKNLARLAAEQARREWVKSGLLELGRELGDELDERDVAERASRAVARYLSAPAAAVYVRAADEEGGAARFRLLGQTALTVGDAPGDAAPSFALGEGLLGEAARGKDVRIIEGVAAGALRLRSGLGDASPQALALVPLVLDDETIGVLELATLGTFDEPAKELLDEVRESISTALVVARSRAVTRKMLAKTREQAALLLAQEETLKSTNEELVCQQEELQEANDELAAQQAALAARNEELEKIRHRLEEQAAELTKVSAYKSQFLANMSHELRTPLNSMLLLSKLLEENGERNLTDKQVEYARTVHSAGRDLLQLINQVLDLAKVEAGKKEIVFGELVVSELAGRMRQLFSPLAQEKGLAFDVRIADAVPARIVTDGQRLGQILTNLLGNAIKFTDSGSVVLSIERGRGDRISFIVTDTGSGIPLEDRARIFAPFEQVDGGRRRSGGTGLGLSIARELAGLLGGTLRLDRSSSQGSIFVCEIPDRPGSAPPVAAKNPDAERSQVHLLVIEDDPVFAGQLGEIIQERGLSHLTAESGRVGIELAKKHRPRGIILDISLPDIDGWQVLEELRNDPRTAAIPVHFVTGSNAAERGIAMGAASYLQKPAERSDLARVVESIGGGPQGALHLFVRRLEAPASARGDSPPDNTLAGKKVLVVDDDMRTVYAVSAMLRAKGGDVVIAENGAAALSALDEHPDVSVVLMDVMMPEMDGYEATRRIRRQPRFSNLPIVALTAKAMKGDLERCIEAGATDYLPKPIDADALLGLIRSRIADVVDA